MYIFVCVGMYIYICMCTQTTRSSLYNICICMYIYVSICNVYLCIYMYVCIYVCMYKCVYVRMCIYVRICMYVYVSQHQQQQSNLYKKQQEEWDMQVQQEMRKRYGKGSSTDNKGRYCYKTPYSISPFCSRMYDPVTVQTPSTFGLFLGLLTKIER